MRYKTEEVEVIFNKSVVLGIMMVTVTLTYEVSADKFGGKGLEERSIKGMKCKLRKTFDILTSR